MTPVGWRQATLTSVLRQMKTRQGIKRTQTARWTTRQQTMALNLKTAGNGDEMTGKSELVPVFEESGEQNTEIEVTEEKQEKEENEEEEGEKEEKKEEKQEKSTKTEED